jgi:hypothetical protein
MQSEAKITSLRKVDWGSMRANFFVMYPVSASCPDVPVTYMGAFRARREAGLRQRAGARLPEHHQRRHERTLNQVQGVLDKVIRAVEFLFGFTLAPAWWCCSPPSRPRAKSGRASSRSCGRWARAAACCGRCSAPSWRRRPAGGLPGLCWRWRRGGGVCGLF